MLSLVFLSMNSYWIVSGYLLKVTPGMLWFFPEWGTHLSPFIPTKEPQTIANNYSGTVESPTPPVPYPTENRK